MSSTHVSHELGAPALIKGRAAEAPNAPAVEAGADTISYELLLERVEQVASSLREQDVGPDVPVGLALEPSIAMVVGMLAVLEAGGACLPLDLAQPPARVGLILEDADPPVIVAHAATLPRLPPTSAVVVRADERPRAAPAADGGADPAGGDLAYLIYTSGSTGTPKGVAMPHRALSNLLDWQLRRFSVRQARTLQYAPLGFDVSFQEILSTLAAGGTLVIGAAEARRDLARFGALLDDARIERLFIPPVALHQVAAGCRAAGRYPRHLREVIVAGEQLRITPALRDFFTAVPGATLDNQYGPTETHVVTAHALTGPASEWPVLPPIGRPIAHARIHLLDPDLRQVPEGEAGEICVAGPCVARGYLNRPDLTTERFIDLALETDTPQRLYRTGDLGRLRADGTLDFLGRNDDQVKVRGYRVELGEVEAALRGHPAVADAAVALKSFGAEGDRRLVGYFVAVPGGDVGSDELRRFVTNHLPDYMLPAALVEIARVPLTANGKTDRAALPLPERRRPSRGREPQSKTEADLAAIWAETLGVETVDVDEDLFVAGADSLLAMRVLARVRDAYGTDLPLQAVFDTPTVGALARAVDEAAPAPAPQPELPRAPRDLVPPSFAQQRLWFLEQVYRGTSVFNIVTRYRIVGRLDADTLRHALEELLRRHDVLRTHFGLRDGTLVQVIAPPARVPIDIVDVSGAQGGHARGAAGEAVVAAMAAPFDLESGPLLRATLLRFGPREHALVVAVHHAVFDGWSQEVFFEELVELYDALRAGGESSLPAPPAQYANYAAWERALAEAGEIDAHVDFWMRTLEGVAGSAELPSDRRRPSVPRHVGATSGIELPSTLVSRLRDVACGAKATLFLALLAGFSAVLHQYTEAVDFVIGSPAANRTRSETDRMLGLFVNLLPLRVNVAGDPGFDDLMRRLRGVTLDAVAHQAAPFERVVQALNPPRTLNRHPIFQIVFAYQHMPVRRREIEGLTFVSEDVHAGGSQFDLLLSVEETDSGAEVVAEYDCDLFDERTIRRLLADYATLLEGAAEAPERPLSRLPLATTGERSVVVRG